jgi:hypothetical protein
VKGIMNAVLDRDQWLVVVKGIMNVVVGGDQWFVLLKKANNFLKVVLVAWL